MGAERDAAVNTLQRLPRCSPIYLPSSWFAGRMSRYPQRFPAWAGWPPGRQRMFFPGRLRRSSLRTSVSGGCMCQNMAFHPMLRGAQRFVRFVARVASPYKRGGDVHAHCGGARA